MTCLLILRKDSISLQMMRQGFNIQFLPHLLASLEPTDMLHPPLMYVIDLHLLEIETYAYYYK